MTFDMIIRGGTIATASDTFNCDVGVKDGKVHLRNPWNSSHPKPLTAAVFQRVFARFSVGDF